MKREIKFVSVALMQKSGADWASVTVPWSMMWGNNASKWMLMLPFSHIDISLKK